MNKAAGVVGLVLMGISGAVCADSWTRIGDVGSNPVTRTTEKDYAFSPTGRVQVREIGGAVRVRTGDAAKVSFQYERKAATQQDFDCETLHVENTPDSLRIWSEHKRESKCRMIRADDTLTLTVPRTASVELDSIGDSVKVSGVEGMVRLSSIGDTATLDGVQQLDADSIGDSLTLDVTKVGPAGIRIDSVGDSVEIALPKGLNARLRIDSVGDEIRGPGLRLSSEDDDYETVLGSGGPLIRISSVGDTVEIRGPNLKGTARDD